MTAVAFSYTACRSAFTGTSGSAGVPAPVWQKVVTEKFATFACTPSADRPPAKTGYVGVFRAGDYVAGDYPATLEGAVRNGIAAARAAITYLHSFEPIG